jgi:hypothetical protein
MTRDMELVRKIFAEIKGRQDAQLHSMEIVGVDEGVLSRHLEMLMDAHLIDGLSTGHAAAPWPTIAPPRTHRHLRCSFS